MKFIMKVVLPIAILVALVGGVTFVSHYAGTPKKTSASTRFEPLVIEEALLAFPVRMAGDAPVEFELLQTYSHEFLFGNPGPMPLDLSVKAKSSTCTKVEVCILGAEERSEMVAAVFDDPLMKTARKLVRKERPWRPLDATGDKIVVPGAPGPKSPVLGLVRLSWQGKNTGRVAVQADMWMERSSVGRVASLAVPAYFVPSFMMHPTRVQLRDLTGKGQQESVEIHCWSATRTGFQLKAREENADPCFACTVKALDAEECKELSAKLGAMSRGGIVNVRSASRVIVTVSERIGERALDLGPFSRSILLNAGDESKPLVVTVGGVVRGEVTLVVPGSKDVIDLRAFPADRGKSDRFFVTTEQQGLELDLKSKPDYLEVELKLESEGMAGQKRWELQVRVPAKRVTGRLPPDSAVVLQIKGGRQLRIPIVGQATQ